MVYCSVKEARMRLCMCIYSILGQAGPYCSPHELYARCLLPMHCCAEPAVPCCAVLCLLCRRSGMRWMS